MAAALPPACYLALDTVGPLNTVAPPDAYRDSAGAPRLHNTAVAVECVGALLLLV